MNQLEPYQWALLAIIVASVVCALVSSVLYQRSRTRAAARRRRRQQDDNEIRESSAAAPASRRPGWLLFFAAIPISAVAGILVAGITDSWRRSNDSPDAESPTADSSDYFVAWPGHGDTSPARETSPATTDEPASEAVTPIQEADATIRELRQALAVVAQQRDEYASDLSKERKLAQLYLEQTRRAEQLAAETERRLGKLETELLAERSRAKRYESELANRQGELARTAEQLATAEQRYRELERQRQVSKPAVPPVSLPGDPSLATSGQQELDSSGWRSVPLGSSPFGSGPAGFAKPRVEVARPFMEAPVSDATIWMWPSSGQATYGTVEALPSVDWIPSSVPWPIGY